jgi:hypothetical protein
MRTDGQTLASQDAELMAAGCAKVYAEKVSGARTDRAELAKVLKRLERDVTGTRRPGYGLMYLTTSETVAVIP